MWVFVWVWVYGGVGGVDVDVNMDIDVSMGSYINLSIHWALTLCGALVLPKQSPWLLDTILDG